MHLYWFFVFFFFLHLSSYYVCSCHFFPNVTVLNYSLISIEKELLESLPLNKQCTEEEQELLHFLFENKLKKVKP